MIKRQWLKVHVVEEEGGGNHEVSPSLCTPGSSSSSAGQSSKGQKVKMGGGFSFPKA